MTERVIIVLSPAATAAGPEHSVPVQLVDRAAADRRLRVQKIPDDAFAQLLAISRRRPEAEFEAEWDPGWTPGPEPEPGFWARFDRQGQWIIGRCLADRAERRRRKREDEAAMREAERAAPTLETLQAAAGGNRATRRATARMTAIEQHKQQRWPDAVGAQDQIGAPLTSIV